MKVAVVIGKDILRQFYEKVTLLLELNENQVIQEIPNIEIDNAQNKVKDWLDINPELDTEI